MGSSSSFTRQDFPRSRVNRCATDTRPATTSLTCSRTPVSLPASRRAAVDSSSAWMPASAPIPEMSPRPSSSANRKRPGNSLSRGSCCTAESRAATSPRTSQSPPLRPDSGEATMLRTRSWVREGQQPRVGETTGNRASVPQPPDLQVAPGGQLDRRGSEVGGGPGHRVQLRRRDHAAGQPDPGELTIGGAVGLQRTGGRRHRRLPCPRVHGTRTRRTALLVSSRHASAIGVRRKGQPANALPQAALPQAFQLRRELAPAR